MHKVTLIPGDGIGPEVSAAARAVLDATGAAIEWETVEAGQHVLEATGELVPAAVFESLERTGVALKGPITTPVGKGFRSINVMLRKKYDLFANVRPVNSLPGVAARYDEVDLVIFRENTEGLYIGQESLNPDGSAQAIKLVTEAGSRRIAQAAFEYARANRRAKVAVVHKANILKLTDGLFLETARAVAAGFPEIQLQEVIIDNMCMQLVMDPRQFEVIVTMNLYGVNLSDLCAGLVGGLGLAPGANLGARHAIFEAVHGSAPDLAGKGLANPIALIRSGALMLRHLGERARSERVEAAIRAVLASGQHLTRDLGGSASTAELTHALIRQLEEMR